MIDCSLAHARVHSPNFQQTSTGFVGLYKPEIQQGSSQCSRGGPLAKLYLGTKIFITKGGEDCWPLEDPLPRGFLSTVLWMKTAVRGSEFQAGAPASLCRSAAPCTPPITSRTVGFRGYPGDCQARSESPGELVENTDPKAQARIAKLHFSGWSHSIYSC